MWTDNKLKTKRKKILKLGVDCGGYLYFKLCENSIIKNYYVSRFVYECFKGDIPNDMEVDHINNDKKNNCIKNLQLLTKKENVRKSHFKKKVKSFNIETLEEKIFESVKEAAKYYQISSSTVCCNCKKITKTTKSKKDGMIYIFNYME